MCARHKTGRSHSDAGRGNEQVVNHVIATILKKERGWMTRAEKTDLVVGKAAQRPDIIAEIDGNIVSVETKYDNASKLEEDARNATRKEIVGHGLPATVLGIMLPAALRPYNMDELEARIMERHDFRYFVLRLDGCRFPSDGYLEGSIVDIMTAMLLSSVPQESVRKCIDMMKTSIEKISVLIRSTDATVKGTICTHIRQKPSQQTWDMASLVLLNAGIFYEELAGCLAAITPTENLKKDGVLAQSMVTNAWREVLGLDYDSIFRIARNMLKCLPAGIAGKILHIMSETMSQIMALKVSKSGDVYGTLYQDMLEDRKRIAAFYTLPEAAALLAGLVMPDDGSLWRSRSRIKRLRIADFACGTGMLLTAAYSTIMARVPSDISPLHAHIMERCLYGYDILPTATHLTTSNLAGLFPAIKFDGTNIYALPIGRDGDGYSLGSLDLLRETARFVKAGEQHGGRGTHETKAATIPDGFCDYTIMNPPYSRATNHGKNRTDPVPPFALFGISPEDQVNMAAQNKKQYGGTCADGNAGLASHFIAICDRKLKPGGVMGLILPNTMATGPSWSKVRSLLNERYDDVMLVLVGSRTYSSNTGMNETMLVARKLDDRRSKGSPPLRIKLALVDGLPASRLEAQEVARGIRVVEPVRLEDDAGHTSILVGSDIVGRALDCPTEGAKWWVARASNVELLRFAWNMAHNKTSVPMTNLNDVGEMGMGHRDITGNRNEKRGPFNRVDLKGMPRYPCLWNNDSKTQRPMVLEPDSSLEKKSGSTMEEVNSVWKKAARSHINGQARYTTQRLIAAYTRAKTVGGRSWPNVIFREPWEKAFTVWCNSVFGIIIYWSAAGAQQGGRGHMSPKAFNAAFPMLDFRRLSEEQIARLNGLFEENCTQDMLPINMLDKDTVRQRLDRGIVDVFGLDVNLAVLYEQLVAEEQFGRSKQEPDMKATE